MGKGRKQGRDKITFPFHNLIVSTLSSGTQTFFLAPIGNISPRAQTEADAWQHFRVKQFSFRLLPNLSRTQRIAVGLIGGVPDTVPTTVAQVMELLPSVTLENGQIVPTEWVRVPAIDLSGPLPWYKTVAGGADVSEESPAVLAIAGTGTDPYVLEVRGVFEFKVACATANTPMAVNLRRLLREEKLLSVMSRERDILLKILRSGGGEPPVLPPVRNIQTGQ